MVVPLCKKHFISYFLPVVAFYCSGESGSESSSEGSDANSDNVSIDLSIWNFSTCIL
jgi:hypothetical protein